MDSRFPSVRAGLLGVAIFAAASGCDHGLPKAPLACRDFVSIGIAEPDGEAAVWRWQGAEKTRLHAIPAPWSGGETVLSPAGDRFAFVHGGEIHIVTFSTGEAQLLGYDGSHGVVDLVGDALVVAAQPAAPTTIGGRRLDVIDLSSGERRTLVPEGDTIDTPRLSPDGATVGFVRGGQLLQVATAGGAPAPLAADVEVSGFAGWSVSGRYFAYTTRDTYDLRVVESSTGATTTVSEQGGVGVARWSPSDDRLLYEDFRPEGAHADRHTAFWVVDADGERALLLDSNLASIIEQRLPTWSRDGQEVAWHGSPADESIDPGAHPLLASDAITGNTVIVHHDWPEQAFLLARCPDAP